MVQWENDTDSDMVDGNLSHWCVKAFPHKRLYMAEPPVNLCSAEVEAEAESEKFQIFKL